MPEQSPKPEHKQLVWTPELVARFWNEVSNSRLSELSFSRIGGKSLYIAIKHLLPPQDGTILDFGAGDGDFLEILCSMGHRAAAYEPAEERASQIRQRLRDYPSFLGSIGEKDQKAYDLLIMAEVIEHILDEQFDETLTHMASLVKKDRIVVVTTPNNEDLDLSSSFCPASGLWFHRWQHVRSFTPDSLCTTMERFGFDKVALHKLEFDSRHFVPYDPIWCEGDIQPPPAYLRAIRQNRDAYWGGENNMLFIGKKR